MKEKENTDGNQSLVNEQEDKKNEGKGNSFRLIRSAIEIPGYFKISD